MLSEIQAKLQENGVQLDEQSKQLDSQERAGNRLADGMYVLLEGSKEPK
jgi:hypothetical protein